MNLKEYEEANPHNNNLYDYTRMKLLELITQHKQSNRTIGGSNIVSSDILGNIIVHRNHYEISMGDFSINKKRCIIGFTNHNNSSINISFYSISALKYHISQHTYIDTIITI